MPPSKEQITARSEKFHAACRRAGLPLTPQRLAIFEYLAGTDAHPTAQQIFEVVRREHPNLSLATVYKNLETFLSLWLIRKVVLPNGTARYDAHLTDHSHIINLDTQEVWDAEPPSQLPAPAALSRYALEAVEVSYFVRNK